MQAECVPLPPKVTITSEQIIDVFKNNNNRFSGADRRMHPSDFIKPLGLMKTDENKTALWDLLNEMSDAGFIKKHKGEPFLKATTFELVD